jgi:SAM-dependent methyltransferase
VVFLNYGYETEPPLGIPLAPEDERNRLCIQLYHHVATQVELTGKHVLEVSCGHGGGASYFTRTLEPASYTAVDLNRAGIRFCEQRHGEIEGLTFFAGDAESLPFAAESVDAVINVEASHCYPNFSRFLAEVARVLRPGGHFLYADFRLNEDLPVWLDELGSTPLELVHARDITSDVLRGLDANAPRSLDVVTRCLPRWMESYGRDFAGIPGSFVYSAFKNGQAVYHSYCFVKPRTEPEPESAQADTAVT